MPLSGKIQKIIDQLGPYFPPDKDPKIHIGMRPQFCCMRDEINMAKEMTIKVRRAALKRLIEADYNLYTRELRKYDYGVTRTQP